MFTLLLRLAGPLQSWGSESKFEIRRTEPIPTKSGVLGMVGAALGRRRDESIEDLKKLRFGVRADQPGILLTDFHMARNDKFPYITRRYYISDGVFLAGLESDDLNFLKKIEWSLKHPQFPLFLGRRSCPVTLPLVLGIKELPLFEALKKEKWLGKDKKVDRSKILISLENGSGILTRYLKDEPESYDPVHRRFTFRKLGDFYISLENKTPEHDPFKDLVEEGSL